MTANQTRILEMFRALNPDEREALLPHLEEEVSGGLDDLSPEDIAAIEEGIAQAERGEVVDGREAMERLAARFGFSLA